MGGHIIRTLQIVKWFRFLSPLRGFMMVDGSCAQGHRFATPLPTVCRPFRAKNHKRPCHFSATDN